MALIHRPGSTLADAQVRTQAATLINVLAQSVPSCRAIRAGLLLNDAPSALLDALRQSSEQLLLLASPHSNSDPSPLASELIRTIEAATRALVSIFTLLVPLATASRFGIGFGRAYFGLAEKALTSHTPARWRTRSRPQSLKSANNSIASSPSLHPASPAPQESVSEDEQIRSKLRLAVKQLYSRPYVHLLSSFLYLSDTLPGSLAGIEDRTRLVNVAGNVCDILSATLSMPSLSPSERPEHLDHDGVMDLDDSSGSSSRDPWHEIRSRSHVLEEFRQATHSAFAQLLSPTAPSTFPDPPRIAVSSSGNSVVRTLSRSSDLDGGVIPQLLAWVDAGPERVQCSAIWVLAELIRGKMEPCVQLLSCTTPSGLLATSKLLHLKSHPNLSLRVAAFTCLAHLIKTHNFTPRTNEHVLTELVQLLDEPDLEIQILSARAIARLVADDYTLQMRASKDLELAPRLVFAVAKAHGNLVPALQDLSGQSAMTPWDLQRWALLQEAALSCLAALAYDYDSIRGMTLDYAPAVLPVTITVLKSPAPLGVRVATLRLLRSLARSITLLRTSLLDAGVGDVLINTILACDATTSVPRQEDEELVTTEALSLLSDLVLSFSPMKARVLDAEHGCLPTIIRLSSHPVEEVRVGALWVLKNALYDTDVQTKERIINAYGWCNLLHTLQPDVRINEQEQALAMVRNLVAGSEEDIQLVLTHLGTSPFLALLENLVHEYAHDNTFLEGIEQAAWIMVNLAAGNEQHRQLLLSRPNLIDGIVTFLSDPWPGLRDAALVCAINLMHSMPPTHEAPPEDQSQLGDCGLAAATALARAGSERVGSTRALAMEAARTLQLFGLESSLHSLAACEEVVDIQARAQSCLALLQQLAPSNTTRDA